jgi:uncharacterized repeat protein (TIGR03803 family)
LYGTTWEGGGITGDLYSIGTVFKITPTGTLTTLQIFCTPGDCLDGTYPAGGLLLAANGDLYGTTLGGGLYNCNDYFPEYPGCGTIFKIAPNGAFTTLYNFCSQANCADGMQPSAPLIRGANGDIYGTTIHGGAYGDYGTVFQLSSNGLTTLHSFCAQSGCPDGSGPSSLMQATNGDLYGTTGQGGANPAPNGLAVARCFDYRWASVSL